jgi:hypothetical protein
MTALRSSFLCRRHRRIHEESIRQAAAHVPTLEPLAHRLSVLPRRTSYLRGMRRVHKRGRAGHSRLMREGDWRPRPSPHDHRYGALCKRPLSKSIDHTAVCLGAAPSGPTSRSRSAGRRWQGLVKSPRPLDAVSRRSVRAAVVSSPFPSGEVLPSTASAEGEPSLFGCFIGTIPSSNFSSAFMLIVRLLPS